MANMMAVLLYRRLSRLQYVLHRTVLLSNYSSSTCLLGFIHPKDLWLFMILALGSFVSKVCVNGIVMFYLVDRTTFPSIKVTAAAAT